MNTKRPGNSDWIGPAAGDRPGASARATLARLRRVDRCHLWRAGGGHWGHGPRRAGPREALGRVTPRAQETGLGGVVVVAAGGGVEIGLVELLEGRDDP